MDKKIDQIVKNMKQAETDVRNLAEMMVMLADQLDKTLISIKKLNAEDINEAIKKPATLMQKELIDLLKELENGGDESQVRENDERQIEHLVRVQKLSILLKLSASKTGRLLRSIHIKTVRYSYGYVAFWTKEELDVIKKQFEEEK